MSAERLNVCNVDHIVVFSHKFWISHSFEHTGVPFSGCRSAELVGSRHYIKRLFGFKAFDKQPLFDHPKMVPAYFRTPYTNASLSSGTHRSHHVLLIPFSLEFN